MSVNVLVFRNASNNAEIQRFENTTTTPVFSRWTKYNDYFYWYRYYYNRVAYYANAGSDVGATKAWTVGEGGFGVWDQPTNALAPNFIKANFIVETGYQALVNKSINSSDISVSIRITSSPTSTQKAIFLSGETAYYHSSVVAGSKYRFVDWRNGETLVSTDAVLSRTITSDLTLTANYEQYKWSLTAQPNNATCGDAYIGVSGTSTTGLYEDGSFETIRAVVKPAYSSTYKFKRWTLSGVEISTEPTLQVTTAEVDKLYVAEFIPIYYTLNVAPQNVAQGTVETYLAGVKQVTNTGLSVAGLSSVEVRATPTFGYYLVGWHNGSGIVSYSSSYPFSMTEANLALEARFAILPDADLIVTKKKGDGAQDPEDMGSVTLYHTVNNFVVASAVGELTFNASIFTTKQYRLVPTPASALFQFDGWYQTIDGSDVLITADTVFNIDGNDLYITVADETAINVIARFSERTLCTIEPVVSDASTYTASNEAEDAGCTCFVNTLPPDNYQDDDGEHDTGDQWLSCQTITVEARQAAGWELRAWYVVRKSDGQTVASKSKGETGFGQVFTFTLLSDVQVIAVSAYTLTADQMQIQALLKSGQPLTSGTVEIHPCGDNYVEMENGSTANVDIGAVCELTAIPANGYKFVGWRVATEGSEIISTLPTYSFTVTASAVYYAEFEATTDKALVLFESSDLNRSLLWSSKTVVTSVPSCFSSARIYADTYPVRLDIGASDNPSHPALPANVLSSLANSQNPFRLPLRRPRKSFVISIAATDTVSEVSVATSMEDLKNG